MKCGTLFLCRDALVPIFTYIKSKWYYRCMTECQGRTCCLGDVILHFFYNFFDALDRNEGKKERKFAP